MSKKHNLRHVPAMLLTVAVIFGCIGADTTYSWFYAQMGSETSAKAGLVNYKPDEASPAGAYGAFIENTKVDDENSYIYPGRELVEIPLRLENFSDVKTNVRVVINGSVERTGTGSTDSAVKESLLLIREEGSRTGHWRLGVIKEGSVVSGGAVTSELIPLLEVLFQETEIDGTPYQWKAVDRNENGNGSGGTGAESWDPQSSDMIWALCQSDKSEAEAFLPPAPSGQTYGTITSAAVISTMQEVGDSPEEVVRKESVFTDLYTGATLHITVKYYAKQQEAMGWEQFYQTELTL